MTAPCAFTDRALSLALSPSDRGERTAVERVRVADAEENQIITRHKSTEPTPVPLP